MGKGKIGEHEKPAAQPVGGEKKRKGLKVVARGKPRKKTERGGSKKKCQRLAAVENEPREEDLEPRGGGGRDVKGKPGGGAKLGGRTR